MVGFCYHRYGWDTEIKGPTAIYGNSEGYEVAANRLWEGRWLELPYGLHCGLFQPSSWELRHSTCR